MKYILILALPLMVLSGCAKMMNENECLTADWRGVGFQDGSQGRDIGWLERRSKACAEHGVTPNMDLYLMGRDQGLQNFCVPGRAFSIGRNGNTYNNVCPANLEGAFLAAYQDGRGLHDREHRFTDIEQALVNAHADLDRLDKDITDITLLLATELDMSNEDRIQYALDLKNMSEDRGRISASIPQMQADLDAARYDLDAFRASIAPKYPGSI